MSLRLPSVHRLTSRARREAHNRRRQRWALEGLEGRVLLSGNFTVYTVTDTSDNASDPGSLILSVHP